MFKCGKVKIGLLDSGIGGLSVLGEICKTASFDTAYYFGDNLNAPYGNRPVSELVMLAYSGVSRLLDAGAEVIVLACNTLSTTAISQLSELFPDTPFFGVFPPVETAEMRGEDYVLLATARTVGAIKKRDPSVNAVALENLAEDIEKNIFNPEKIDISAHLTGVRKTYKNVVLGCTHYAFVERQIGAYFGSPEIFSGIHNTARAVTDYINRFTHGTRARRNEIVFIGPSAEKNKAVFSGFYALTQKN